MRYCQIIDFIDLYFKMAAKSGAILSGQKFGYAMYFRGVYSYRVLCALPTPRSKLLGCCPVFILMEKGISALNQGIFCPVL